ncbi:MAG: CBS domain-containing protein [Bryobacteraceae bacterium]|nr:CBS domain-containing protein [Bryobacteraceae bacterium]
MTVAEIMNSQPVTLRAGQAFAEGFALLLARRIRSLPLVDDAGTYLGMFEVRDVWEALLPKAATLGARGLRDLSFVPGTAADLRDRLAQAGPRPAIEFAGNESTPPIPPETPVKEAMRLLYDHGGILPVVDPASKRLLGIVSTWEILGTLG